MSQYFTFLRPAKCRVYNATKEDLGSAWEVALEYTPFFHIGSCMRNVNLMLSEAWTDVELPVFPDSPSSGKLVIRISGYVFEGGETAISLESGKEYRIEYDRLCPPLTAHEIDIGYSAIRDMVEGEGPFPPPVSKYGNNPREPGIPEAWKYVVDKIGRDSSSDQIVTKVWNMMADGSCFASNRRGWSLLYDTHPRTIPVDNTDSSRVLSVIANRDCIIEVYHRAMDRYPGGNSDIRLVKHTYLPSQGLIVVKDYCNWDGGSNILEEPLQLLDDKVTRFSNVFPALEALFKINTSRDITCTVDDPSCDSDEYDTEWSSIEILVFDSNKQTLLARVHQRARLTVDRNREPTLIDAMPALPETQHVLDIVETALQMGRVENFSENDPFFGRRVEWDWHGYIVPLYIGDNYGNHGDNKSSPTGVEEC